MNNKPITVCALATAVISLSVALVVRSVKNAETVRLEAERVASMEEIKVRESRQAEAEANAEKAKEATTKAAKEKAELEQKTAEENARAAQAEKARAEAEADAAKAKAAAAKEDRERAKLEAEAAKAKAAAAEAEAAKEKAAKARAAAEAEAAANRRATEQAKAEALALEVKAIELRKLNLESAERELIAFQQELDERERALHPDKTAADLVWVGEREPDEIGATGVVRRAARVVVRPEDDLSLPRPTRNLARCEREVNEVTSSLTGQSSNLVVSALERLYLQAREERRLIDAAFYAQSIRHLYPHWSYPQPSKKGAQP